MRKRAKKDANHNALRDVGYLVAETHQLGSGYPDLTIAGIDRATGQRRIWLVEIKTRKGALTPDEQTFHQQWIGYVHTVRSVDDAYRLVGVM